MHPLANLRIVSLAGRLPGPLALSRLVCLGAVATKIEPVEGDALQRACPRWYEVLHRGIEVVVRDLKEASGRARLEDLLASCDLLLTATRPAGLARLGLSWPELHQRHSRLCQVAIVGHKAPNDERAGHDLTYQAECGLLDPPHLPRALIADVAGAHQAVAAALALVLARERGLGSGYAEVALAAAAADFAAPWHNGLTTPEGLLGGALPGYNLYRARDGWVAVAALEPQFWQRLGQAVGCDSPSTEQLAAFFRSGTASEWEAWGRERDVPVAAVRFSATEG